MSEAASFRVVFVDRHHPAAREAFEQIPVLDVRQVSTLEEAFHAAALADAQALVVDVAIAREADYAGLTRIRTAFPGLATIVLTDADQEEAALAAQRRGAHEYLVRETLDPATIAHTLRSARRIAELECLLLTLDTQLEQANRRLRDILLDMARHRQPSLERSARLVRSGDTSKASDAAAESLPARSDIDRPARTRLATSASAD